MTYELAKQLKDSFPYLEKYQGKREVLYFFPDFMGYEIPTLSELIEACGNVTVLIWGCNAHGYHASSQPCAQMFHEIDSALAQAEGSTPEEAVLLLWITLHSSTSRANNS
jgi:hypothetical protein